jgi:hypothetical protein
VQGVFTHNDQRQKEKAPWGALSFYGQCGLGIEVSILGRNTQYSAALIVGL